MRTSSGETVLHVIDANCSWIRSLADAAPPSLRIRTYRIYSPQWLPNGRKDLPRCFRSRQTDDRTDETLVVVPGWNKAPKASAYILRAVLGPRLRREAGSSAVVFTFPFYSAVAEWIKARFPFVPLAYHAHDPFEFYAYPPGYIRMHEDRLVPLCNRIFAIAEKLQEDFQQRYPGVVVDVLGNGVADSFLQLPQQKEQEKELRQIQAVGRPVVGVVGQINKAYDWDLLEAAAEANPQMQLVLIGNLFEEGAVTERIRVFFQRANVHWLGPKPHNELKSYMDSCDILLNPLAVNAQNDRRDTLRLYDYLSTKATVVSTAIDGVRRHGDLVRVPPSRSELISFLGQRPPAVSDEEVARRRAYLAENTWASRGRQLTEALIPRLP
jgi:glycosyltransferase involved in cell wall biosynthesis